MLFVQVGILILFSSAMGLYKFYASLTVYLDKSNERKEIEHFLAQICILITYINNSMTFFAYTLSGKIFRQELFKLVQTFH
ncbi:unnamed protein product [Adineta ricciae]|uniref:Uncharacterized protein n=1 Tax=Adineta ricciae TaxID=249248 RepID=A0A816HQE4_ADIRI|nr:unnamed protein product [Adineta ricciae]